MSKHGYADWGIYAATETVVALQDMAELAARLGSILTFDRAGNLAWYEDFESGFGRWTGYTDGAGAAVSLSVDAYRSGAYACKLVPGSDGALQAGIELYLVALAGSQFGLELSFTLTAQLTSWEFYFDLWTRTLRNEPRVRWLKAGGTLQVRNSASGWTTVASGLLLLQGSTYFHTLKVSVDLENLTYKRLLLDDLSYDISDIALRSYAATVVPCIFLACEAYGVAGANPTFYIDDVIITQNEP